MLFQSACLIVPYGRITAIQLCFGVLVLMYLFCLFGIAEFYVLLNLHNTESHTHRIRCTKFRINTDVPPDDGHINARNMQRLININILGNICARIRIYLQDYENVVK
jgi:hypothetical protein